MKHGYSKNGAVPILDTFEYLYSWDTFACAPQAYLNFSKKKRKSFSFIFSFGYVIKIDKSSKSSGKMNFKCNYMNVHFFYLLF